MDEEDFNLELEAASGLLHEEGQRTNLRVNQVSMERQQNYMTSEDIANLKKKHAFLDDFSESFIRNTPIGDLMRIESTALKMREVERAKDADDKLAANKAALTSTYTTVSKCNNKKFLSA
jgi:hypothetical protein